MHFPEYTFHTFFHTQSIVPLPANPLSAFSLCVCWCACTQIKDLCKPITIWFFFIEKRLQVLTFIYIPQWTIKRSIIIILFWKSLKMRKHVWWKMLASKAIFLYRKASKHVCKEWLHRTYNHQWYCNSTSHNVLLVLVSVTMSSTFSLQILVGIRSLPCKTA